MSWENEVEYLSKILSELSFCDENNKALACDEGFQRWSNVTESVRVNKGTIYLIGNGASASMASHFAADLAKNGHLHTQVFSDLALITAISNDISYEQVFAEPLKRRGKDGDMLVAISSSGSSPNILSAVEVGKNLGLHVVTLSAMRPDNPLRTMGDLNGYVSAISYGQAETCHAAILHRWTDLVEVKAG